MPRAPKAPQVGEKWVSTVGSSSFEVASVDPLVIEVTRRIPVRGGEPKVEKRRREVAAGDIAFFTRIYKRL